MIVSEEENARNNGDIDNIPQRQSPILKSEVEAALRKLNNHKSSGSDTIVAEMQRQQNRRSTTAEMYRKTVNIPKDGQNQSTYLYIKRDLKMSVLRSLYSWKKCIKPAICG